MCKRRYDDIVDELLAVKSRSKGELLRRAALVIKGLREEVGKEHKRYCESEAHRDGMRRTNAKLRRNVEMLKESRRVWAEKAMELTARLEEERYLHDRLQDFCVAQGLELEKALSDRPAAGQLSQRESQENGGGCGEPFEVGRL